MSGARRWVGGPESHQSQRLRTQVLRGSTAFPEMAVHIQHSGCGWALVTSDKLGVQDGDGVPESLGLRKQGDSRRVWSTVPWKEPLDCDRAVQGVRP